MYLQYIKYAGMIKSICSSTRTCKNRLKIRKDTHHLLFPHQGLTIQLFSIYSIPATISIALRDRNRRLNSLTFLRGILHARVTRSVISRLYSRLSSFGSERSRIGSTILASSEEISVRYITSSATGLRLSLPREDCE